MAETVTAELPRFRVRAGLTVHRRRRLKNQGLGRKPGDWHVEKFGGGLGPEELELLEDEVHKHAHALEPLNEAAAHALARFNYVPPAPPALAPGQELVSLESAVRLVKLLVERGLMAVPKAGQ